MKVVIAVVAICSAVCVAKLDIPQCFQYADTQIYGKFSLDTPSTDLGNKTDFTRLSLLYDSLGVKDCDASMSTTFPSVCFFISTPLSCLRTFCFKFFTFFFDD